MYTCKELVPQKENGQKLIKEETLHSSWTPKQQKMDCNIRCSNLHKGVYSIYIRKILLFLSMHKDPKNCQWKKVPGTLLPPSQPKKDH